MRRYGHVTGPTDDKSVRRYYRSQMSGLKGIPNDVGCQADGYASHAVEWPTIVELDGDGILKRYPRIFSNLQMIFCKLQSRETDALHSNWSIL